MDGVQRIPGSHEGFSSYSVDTSFVKKVGEWEAGMEGLRRVEVVARFAFLEMTPCTVGTGCSTAETRLR